MRSSGVGRRTISVSLVTGFSTLLSIIFQLISVPVCLHFWGAEKYGTWLAIFTVSTMFRTIDGGFINFVGNRLNLLYHRDQIELHRVLASSIIGVAVLGIVQLAIVLFVSVGGELGWLLGNGSALAAHSEFEALLILVFAWVLAGSYIGIVHRLLIPAGLMYESAWWSMAYQASMFIALMSSAILQLNLFGAALLISVAQALIYLASAAYIKEKLPSFYPWWKNPDLRRGLADLKDSWIFMVSGLLQQLSVGGIVLLVSSVFGAASVPLFTTLRTMANLWNNVTNTLTLPLVPDLIRFHVTGQYEKIMSLVHAHMWLISMIVNLGMVLAFPLMIYAYSYWTKGKLIMNVALFSLLLSSIVLTNVGALIAAYLSGINNSKAVLITSSARAFISLIFGFSAISYGLIGIGLGLVLAEIVCLVISIKYFNQQENHRINGYLFAKSVMWPLISSIATIAYLMAISSGSIPLIPLYILMLLFLAFVSVKGWQALNLDVKSKMKSVLSEYWKH